MSKDNLPARSADQISGPNISGKVTVDLHELDKMRSDHANLKKLAAELEEKSKEVKIVIEERKEYNRYVDNSWGNSRWVKDSRYEEISVKYKGLNEVKSILRQEVEEDVKTEMTKLQEAIQKQKDIAVKDQQQIIELQAALKTAGTEKSNKDKEVEDLKAELEKKELLNKILEKEIADREAVIKKTGDELHELKIKKSFWYYLFVKLHGRPNN
jgi:chromosome segregation ATPase